MNACKKHGGYSDYHTVGHLVGQKVDCYDCWLQKGDGMLDKIMKYEQGEMNAGEILDFFHELVETGLIHELQGHYQRTATRLMNAGLITMPQGE